jgi:hypothetical protein
VEGARVRGWARKTLNYFAYSKDGEFLRASGERPEEKAFTFYAMRRNETKVP